MADLGENLFESAWLRCRLAASFKQEEAFIRIDGASRYPEAPAFYVDRGLVDPQPPTTNDEVDGRVSVTLLHRNNGVSLVEVSGEPVTFGPRLEVPSDLLA